jgi:hypothetical protein
MCHAGTHARAASGFRRSHFGLVRQFCKNWLTQLFQCNPTAARSPRSVPGIEALVGREQRLQGALASNASFW